MAAATSGKSILSDLDENACTNNNDERHSETDHIDGKGGNDDVIDDSSIFKSFFKPNGIERQSENQVILPQACNTNEPEQVMLRPQKCSDSLSNNLELTNDVETDLMERTKYQVIHELSSESSQSEKKVSVCNGVVRNEDVYCFDSRQDCENTIMDGCCDTVNDERETTKISNVPNLTFKQTASDSCGFDNLENDFKTKRESNSVCEYKISLCTDKIECLDSGCKKLSENHDARDSLIKLSFGEDNIVIYNKSCCPEKENSVLSIDGEVTTVNGAVDLYESDPFKLTDEEHLPVSRKIKETCEKKTMYEKVVNGSDLKCESKKPDPFTLSGDEDFSPKAYKPIKRKLNQGTSDLKTYKLNLQGDDSNDAGCDDKRQKLLQDEDLSLSDMSGRKPVCVAYVHSEELVDKANKLIRIEGRAQLVHSLIEVYGILEHVDVIPPRLATETEIAGFHCSEYMAFLKTLKDSDDLTDSNSAEAEAYGLSYDCPVQEDVFETASLISGATIAGAETLINGTASIAINWCGGWHHAKRDSASGFCYINDIVLGILKLREKFDRVLYVDLDLHHGDGVEEAFYMTPKVMTVSFHKYAFGFFPGSGSLEDTGSGRGRLYSINVPLMDGIGDRQFFSVFTSVMKKVREKFNAEAIVVQCGADALSEDPMASFNLTHVGLAKCVCFLLTWSLPTLLLGGGGYNFPNTAKCWTFLTAMAAGKKLPVDIPEHEHLMEYGPSFELTTSVGNRKDCNTKEHFYEIMAKICKNLNSL